MTYKTINMIIYNNVKPRTTSSTYTLNKALSPETLQASSATSTSRHRSFRIATVDVIASSRGRLVLKGGGDDAGQPTLTSCDVEHQAIFTLPLKVDSFRAYDSIGLHVNGMLFDPNAPCVARNLSLYMMTRGGAKGVMEDNNTKAEAWKRRRNRRHDEKMAKDVFESNTTKTEAWKRRMNRRGVKETSTGTTAWRPNQHYHSTTARVPLGILQVTRNPTGT